MFVEKKEEICRVNISAQLKRLDVQECCHLGHARKGNTSCVNVPFIGRSFVLSYTYEGHVVGRTTRE